MLQLNRSLCKGLGARAPIAVGATSSFTVVKFGPEISRNAVDDNQAHVVPLYNDGDLVVQDVLLRFEVVDVRAVDTAEGGLIVERECGERGMSG